MHHVRCTFTDQKHCRYESRGPPSQGTARMFLPPVPGQRRLIWHAQGMCHMFVTKPSSSKPSHSQLQVHSGHPHSVLIVVVHYHASRNNQGVLYSAFHPPHHHASRNNPGVLYSAFHPPHSPQTFTDVRPHGLKHACSLQCCPTTWVKCCDTLRLVCVACSCFLALPLTWSCNCPVLLVNCPWQHVTHSAVNQPVVVAEPGVQL